MFNSTWSLIGEAIKKSPACRELVLNFQNSGSKWQVIPKIHSERNNLTSKNDKYVTTCHNQNILQSTHHLFTSPSFPERSNILISCRFPTWSPSKFAFVSSVLLQRCSRLCKDISLGERLLWCGKSIVLVLLGVVVVVVVVAGAACCDLWSVCLIQPRAPSDWIVGVWEYPFLHTMYWKKILRSCCCPWL